ncbi:MAG: peptide ABC transporter substrate-binding protein [Candidatus Eremiobacteraeota bacterium]|nr:peptide ABC transporter substrate-binding protein [Candidatus Eremiobacteraeota bacterium]
MRCRIAFAAVLVLVFSSLVACSKVTTSSQPGQQSNAWTKHGVLRMAELTEPDTLNPFVGNQQIEADLSMFWAGYLFRWNDRNEFVPELATEVPTTQNGDISKDGLAITYHLRKGVRWDDGQPFGADDVTYSWQQVMNKRNNVGSRQGYELIERIDKKDDFTIIVHLRRVYAPFVANFFSMAPTVLNILPKHVLQGYADVNRVPYNDHPVGIGPFKVARYDHGSQLELVANPRYWRGPPKLKRIDVKFIPDQNTIVTQLRTHEIDMERAGDPGYIDTYRSLPGMHVTITPFTAFAQLALNQERPVLRDKRVRQALTYAMDRQTIIRQVVRGVHSPANSDQPPFLWAYNPAVRTYPFDPSRARALFDAAGWKRQPDGFRYRHGERLALQMVANTGGGTTRKVELIVQQQWRSVGVDASIKEYAPPLYFASYGAGGILEGSKFDVAFFGWAGGVDPDDATLWMCDQIPPAGQNIYHFCDPALDRAEKTARTTYDQSYRKKAYDTIQNILAEEQPAVFVWFINRVSVVNRDLKGFKPAHAVTVIWNPWEWEI